MTHELRLSHGLYNAGLLGFIRIIEKAGKAHYLDYDQANDSLKLDIKALEGFEKDYYNYFNSVYGEGTTTYKMIAGYKTLVAGSETFEEAFKGWEEKYIPKLTQKTGAYASAYEIIKSTKNDNFDPISEIKLAKKEKKDSKKYYDLLSPVISYLDTYRDIFIYKNLAYTILDSYWSGVSFLAPKKVKNDMDKSYKEDFISPIFLADEQIDVNGKYECNECFTRFKKNQVEATSTWVKDMGVDFKRKPSHYWNFKVSEGVCPLCKLIYSCIPGGFFTINRKGMFINVNSSFGDLISMNSHSKEVASYESYDSYQEMSFGQVMRYVDIAFDETIQKGHLSAIQLIRREGSSSSDLKYRIEHLGEKQLRILKDCQRELTYYKNRYYQEHDAFVSIYTEIVQNISNGQHLYKMLAYLIRTPNEKSKLKKSVRLLPLLNIETTMSFYRDQGVKGGNKVLEANKKKTYVMFQKGLEMRKNQANLSEEEIDNKFKGLIYQLTNALQARNKEAFMDRILRLYTSQSKTVPTLFLDMLNSEEALMTYGYAYIIGLKGEEIKENKEA